MPSSSFGCAHHEAHLDSDGTSDLPEDYGGPTTLKTVCILMVYAHRIKDAYVCTAQVYALSLQPQRIATWTEPFQMSSPTTACHDVHWKRKQTRKN